MQEAKKKKKTIGKIIQQNKTGMIKISNPKDYYPKGKRRKKKTDKCKNHDLIAVF